MLAVVLFFFFSSRRRHTRCSRDWSSDVCSSDLEIAHIDGAVLMPLGELPDRLGELDGHHEIVTHCHHGARSRSEEHTSELQSRLHLVCRLLLEKKKKKDKNTMIRCPSERRNDYS